MLNTLLQSSRPRSRRARYILFGSGIVCSAALLYRAYHSERGIESRRYFQRLRSALQRYVDALATGGEICASSLRDLQNFLQSEGDEVPNSVRQIAKLLSSPEVAATTTSTVTAVYRGVAGPPREDQTNSLEQEPSSGPQPAAIDKVLDALLSDRGHSLVSVAVSMGAKNLMSSYLETTQRLQGGANNEQQPQSNTSDKVLDFLSSQSGQHLAVLCVAAFASNGMRVYMDKSLEVNLYEDLFSSMSKPAHLEAVKQCVGVFARDIVAAYLQGGNGISNNDNTSNNSNGASTSHTNTMSETLSTLPPAPRMTPLDHNIAEEQLPTTYIEELPSSSLAMAHDVAPTVQVVDGNDEQQQQTTSPYSSTERRIGAAWTRQDDLDSDGLLHEGSGRTSALRQQQQNGVTRRPCSSLAHKTDGHATTKQQRNTEWVTAVGKEWLNVVKDPAGREAVVSIIGSATREVVQGVAGVASERMSMIWFMFVLFLGMITAWVIQAVLRTSAAALGL